MVSWRMLVLFIHVGAVIVALGGSLFTTFALTPILAQELEAPSRVQVSRRVIRRLGAIVLTALALLVFTGILNVLLTGIFSALLMIKLVLVAVVIVLATYQYANLGSRIWRLSAAGPRPELAPLQKRFRRIGLTVGTLVLLIVYLSLGLTRAGAGVSQRRLGLDWLRSHSDWCESLHCANAANAEIFCTQIIFCSLTGHIALLMNRHLRTGVTT